MDGKKQNFHNSALEQTSVSLSEPAHHPMFKVYLENDDYTPMTFVVDVLQRFFAHPADRAEEIMLQVHQKGRGVCGVYARDVAETKVTLVNEFSKRNQYPLLCRMEEEHNAQ